MAMNLGALGQVCGLCGLPVGAPSGIVMPGQQGSGTHCSGHTPEQALQIMFGRVAQLEQYVHVLMTEREAAIQADPDAVTVTVPEGMSDEDAMAMIEEQVANEIQRDDT